jgi:hypothetical protein
MEITTPKTGWPKKILEWDDGDKVFLSIVFTWQLPQAWSRCVWYKEQGYQVHVGGPAVGLFPDYLSPVATVNGVTINALARHNNQATRFSTGCINNCSFCAVPITEGYLRECEGKPRPIVCDNNLLACSRRHFDYVIDTLKHVRGVDMNQGLDCRLITPYHIDRLRELNLHCIRFAWDHIKEESKVMRAIELCLTAGIPRSKVRVYVLVGYHDTPGDALYRLQTLKDMGLRKNSPMRFQEIKGDKALVKDSYLEPTWTEYEMRRFMHYWFRQAWVSNIPYADWRG